MAWAPASSPFEGRRGLGSGPVLTFSLHVELYGVHVQLRRPSLLGPGLRWWFWAQFPGPGPSDCPLQLLPSCGRGGAVEKGPFLSLWVVFFSLPFLATFSHGPAPTHIYPGVIRAGV